MKTTSAEQRTQFFYEHAGYSYNPATETQEQGRMRCALELAIAEVEAAGRLAFEWGIDPTTNSSDFDDSEEPWELWCCLCRDENGHAVASLGGIDFGRNGEPWGDPYKRVVEAELAMEALPC